MSEEIWRPAVGLPNYEVSDKGRVRSLGRTFQRRGCQVRVRERILGGWIKRRAGRPMFRGVTLGRTGHRYYTRIHRLVLEAFVGPCPPGMEGCHNDGNPLNNLLANLRWDTHVNNLRDAVTHGTFVPPPVHWGEAHPLAKLTDEQVDEIRRAPTGHGTRAKLARQYGVSGNSIGRIRAGKQRIARAA